MMMSNNNDINSTYPLHALVHDTIVGRLPSLAHRIQRPVELAFGFHTTAATLTLNDLHLVFLQNKPPATRLLLDPLKEQQQLLFNQRIAM